MGVDWVAADDRGQFFECVDRGCALVLVAPGDSSALFGGELSDWGGVVCGLHGGTQCGGDFPGGLSVVGASELPVFCPGWRVELFARTDVWIFTGVLAGGVDLWVFSFSIAAEVRVAGDLLFEWLDHHSCHGDAVSMGRVFAQLDRCIEDVTEDVAVRIFGKSFAGTVGVGLCRVGVGFCDASSDVLLG